MKEIFTPNRTLLDIVQDGVLEEMFFISKGHKYNFHGDFIDVTNNFRTTVWVYYGKKTSVFLIPFDNLKYRYQYD